MGGADESLWTRGILRESQRRVAISASEIQTVSESFRVKETEKK